MIVAIIVDLCWRREKSQFLIDLATGSVPWAFHSVSVVVAVILIWVLLHSVVPRWHRGQWPCCCIVDSIPQRIGKRTDGEGWLRHDKPCEMATAPGTSPIVSRIDNTNLPLLAALHVSNWRWHFCYRYSFLNKQTICCAACRFHNEKDVPVSIFRFCQSFLTSMKLNGKSFRVRRIFNWHSCQRETVWEFYIEISIVRRIVLSWPIY